MQKKSAIATTLNGFIYGFCSFAIGAAAEISAREKRSVEMAELGL
jgi:hypothetical protein